MSGLCSRREAEKRIQSFDVTVNGRVVADVATVVALDKDVVAVDGRVLSKTQKVKVWMAHKMKGVRSLAAAAREDDGAGTHCDVLIGAAGTGDEQRPAGPRHDLRPTASHGTHAAHDAGAGAPQDGGGARVPRSSARQRGGVQVAGAPARTAGGRHQVPTHQGDGAVHRQEGLVVAGESHGGQGAWC
ncbi:unnamed protein product [Phytophthora fragariaefolia]|uniref:Unnamed protein product n=1 Tax=Phytophthora fragariaefolia TaxID=1490495 RepID=A0A9W6X717_9STRA|nr:unnamed protein product [Phytophthora fragariaefolia]